MQCVVAVCWSKPNRRQAVLMRRWFSVYLFWFLWFDEIVHFPSSHIHQFGFNQNQIREMKTKWFDETLMYQCKNVKMPKWQEMKHSLTREWCFGVKWLILRDLCISAWSRMWCSCKNTKCIRKKARDFFQSQHQKSDSAASQDGAQNNVKLFTIKIKSPSILQITNPQHVNPFHGRLWTGVDVSTTGNTTRWCDFLRKSVLPHHAVNVKHLLLSVWLLVLAFDLVLIIWRGERTWSNWQDMDAVWR